nr:LysM peptidoglycan-binding domain-containing protein [Anaerolineae bacterium]
MPIIEHEDKKGAAFLGTYTVKKGDTLSAIALEYYKSGDREKWMKIYNANKAVIGDNPNALQPGQKLRIPKLD